MLRQLLAKANQGVSQILIFLCQGYQKAWSAVMPPRCRFYPTCSQYAIEALRTHTVPYAVWLIVKRLVKCQPCCRGGYDPVPEKKPKAL